MKPGGGVTGGGSGVQFAANCAAVEKRIRAWARIARKFQRRRAVCVVQQAIGTPRRALLPRGPSVFELRAMVLIAGRSMDAECQSSRAKDFGRRLKDGSVHLFSSLRVKTAEVPMSDSSEPLLLNRRVQLGLGKGMRVLKEGQHDTQKDREFAYYQNCLSLEELARALGEGADEAGRQNIRMKLAEITLPSIVSAVHDTAHACCFVLRGNKAARDNNSGTPWLPRGMLVLAAFDFIVDTAGAPWLLEVNVKKWLRFCGVGTADAFPLPLARQISSGVLAGILDLCACHS